VAELADAQDLKSCGPKRPYRFDSGLRHHIAGWSSSVARRAHNPKVVGSNPSPATNLVALLDSIRQGFLLPKTCIFFIIYRLTTLYIYATVENEFIMKRVET
jgi:hypothetical protein